MQSSRHTTISKWTPKTCEQAYELALLGATDALMAKIFGIDVKTFEHWKRTKPELRDALERGKGEADSKVVAALFKRATGYTIKEQHVSIFKGVAVVTEVEREIIPDVAACLKWLAIRQRQTWSEVQRVETTQTHININKFDFSGLSTEEMLVIRKAGLLQLTENAEN